MTNIDYIEMLVDNMNDKIQIYIDVKASTIVINNKLKKISDIKIQELLEIIKYWDKSYHNFILDAEKFSIKLIAQNKIIKMCECNGKYPYNYKKIKRWISDII